MENNMKILELVLDENSSKFGVNCISIVNDPAMEASFIALNKEYEIKLSFDEEKHTITGPVMIPDKLILRNIDGNYVQVYFSADTIRKTSELYLKNSYQNNSTLEHSVELKGISTIESWIKEDEVHDKSLKFDMDYPIGTWFITQKVYNDDVWTNEIKTGKVKGFSIEGFYTEKREKPIDEDEKLLNKIKELLEKCN